jgi:MFS family permease
VSGERRPADELERTVRRGREALGGAYGAADRALDRGQERAFRLFWFFLPETSFLRSPPMEQLLASRFLSDAGQQAIAYGALVAVARQGGSALDLALVGAAATLPPALLGVYGGMVADALPQRLALAAVYNLQALLCLLTPSLVGTDLGAMLFLLFAVSALGQVSGPTESAALPLVARRTELASAAAVSLASTLGTAFGTALLAPVIVKAAGVRPVLYLSGVLLIVAASRVFDLPGSRERQTIPHPSLPRLVDTLRWFLAQPAVTTMVFLAALAGTASIAVQTLAPVYVREVLNEDPANAVYVFAPSALGLLAALFLTPRLIDRLGERSGALLGFSCVGLALLGLGFVGELAGVVDVANPFRLLALLGIERGEDLRAAALLAALLGLGLALTAISVQTYVNRRVPLSHQGRAFAMQSSLKNAAAVVPLLGLGAAAASVGVETVLRFTPLALLALAYGLLQLSSVVRGQTPQAGLQVLASYWEEPAEVGPADAP